MLPFGLRKAFLAMVLFLALHCLSPSASMLAEPSPTTGDYSDLVTGTDPVSTRVVRLSVPLVLQSRGPLCGPASIEMIFRFWGETRYDQYDIARALAWKFRDERRYRDSDTVKQIRNGRTASQMNWGSYPGTGTYYMRTFLEPFAPTDNPRIKALPSDDLEAKKVARRFLQKMKGHLDSGVPVIVHQWYDARKTSQHYRIVTGYDDRKRILFLNDPRKGALEMSEEEFLELWRVEEDWLPFNFIVFNRYAPGQIKRGQLRVTL